MMESMSNDRAALRDAVAATRIAASHRSACAVRGRYLSRCHNIEHAE